MYSVLVLSLQGAKVSYPDIKTTQDNQNIPLSSCLFFSSPHGTDLHDKKLGHIKYFVEENIERSKKEQTADFVRQTMNQCYRSVVLVQFF